MEHSPLLILIPLGSNIRLRTLFSYTFSVRPSLYTRDHVSQPYCTTGNIIVIIYFNFQILREKPRRQKFLDWIITWISCCTIICCINRFTSLCKNLFNLPKFLTEAFRCHVHHFHTMMHMHREASTKNSSKLNKFLHSEVSLLIQQMNFLPKQIFEGSCFKSVNSLFWKTMAGFCEGELVGVRNQHPACSALY